MGPPERRRLEMSPNCVQYTSAGPVETVMPEAREIAVSLGLALPSPSKASHLARLPGQAAGVATSLDSPLSDQAPYI